MDMEFDFSELKNTLENVFDAFADSLEDVAKKERARQIVNLEEDEAKNLKSTSIAGTIKERTKTTGEKDKVPIYDYGLYHYRLFSNYEDMNDEVCFFQWKSSTLFSFHVGDYIESEYIGEDEGKWRIKSICYDIIPYSNVFESNNCVVAMIDIDVEFVPY